MNATKLILHFTKATIALVLALLTTIAVSAQTTTEKLGKYTFTKDGDWYLIQSLQDLKNFAAYSRTDHCNGLKFRQTVDILIL